MSISEHPFTRGVQKLKFHRPSPVAVTDKSKGKILAKAPPELGEGIIAVARVGDGEMIAVGISLWWYCIANPMEKDSDNAVLLKNLLMRPRK